MNIEKPQLIAGGFILLGCFLCIFGVYLSFGSTAEVQPPNPYLSTVNYNSGTAVKSANSNAVKQIISTRSPNEKVKSIEQNPVVPLEITPVAETKPVVKETPPYPAPEGAKWQRVKNGWILSPAKSQKPNYNTAEIKPEPYPPPRQNNTEPSSDSNKPCKDFVKVNGVIRCND